MPRFDAIFANAKLVGEGSFGKVFRARYTLTSGAQSEDAWVAVKLIPIHTLNEHQMRGIESEIHVLREMRRVTGQCNPFVVCYYDSMTVLYNETRYLAVATEYIYGHTLSTYLEKVHKSNPDAVRKIAIHLCRGLSFMHANNVVHRDIKPENIMFSEVGALKYIDFGFSCSFDALLHSPCTYRRKGTPRFLAPEVISSIRRITVPQTESEAFKKLDVWALGVTFYMFINDDPWPEVQLEGGDVGKYLEKLSIVQRSRPLVGQTDFDKFPDMHNILRLIEVMTTYSVDQRPDAAQVTYLAEAL